MTTSPLTQSAQANELAPWVIVSQPAQAGGQDQLVLWRMAADLLSSPPASATLQHPVRPQSTESPISSAFDAQHALALFSDHTAAEQYAERHCTERSRDLRVTQFNSLQLVSVLVECYRAGMRYAALNPGGTSAQQIFVLRDVLAAAKRRLHDTGGL